MGPGTRLLQWQRCTAAAVRRTRSRVRGAEFCPCMNSTHASAGCGTPRAGLSWPGGKVVPCRKSEWDTYCTHHAARANSDTATAFETPYSAPEPSRARRRTHIGVRTHWRTAAHRGARHDRSRARTYVSRRSRTPRASHAGNTPLSGVTTWAAEEGGVRQVVNKGQGEGTAPVPHRQPALCRRKARPGGGSDAQRPQPLARCHIHNCYFIYTCHPQRAEQTSRPHCCEAQQA